MTGDQFIGLAHSVEVAGETYVIEGPADADARTRSAHAQGDPNPAYWAHLWPMARAFAHFVAETTWITPQTRVLEIGCGLGLVGIVAARRAAHVTLTDVSPEAVAMAARNASCNRLANVSAQVYDFHAPPDPAWQVDLLLASDVLYAPAAHAALAALIRGLNVPALLADPNRIPADNLEAEYEALGLSVWQTRIEGGRVFVVQ